jgi:hypothetical protein
VLSVDPSWKAGGLTVKFIGFAIVAVVVYLLANSVIKAYENYSGKALQNRQIIFFIIFFALITLSFEVIRALFDKSLT